jgi:hypothetical protein
MVLIDTSVWIEYFKNTLVQKEHMKKLIEERDVIMPDIIAGELLQGAKGQRERTIIEMYYENLIHPDIASLFIKAGTYSIENRLTDKGVGLIDAAIIVTAIETKAAVWTLDKKLVSCLEAGLLYKPEYA